MRRFEDPLRALASVFLAGAAQRLGQRAAAG
jgi:hypothetical protein